MTGIHLPEQNFSDGRGWGRQNEPCRDTLETESRARDFKFQVVKTSRAETRWKLGNTSACFGIGSSKRAVQRHAGNDILSSCRNLMSSKRAVQRHAGNSKSLCKSIVRRQNEPCRDTLETLTIIARCSYRSSKRAVQRHAGNFEACFCAPGISSSKRAVQRHAGNIRQDL